MARLPGYFYDLQAITPDGTERWADNFNDDAPSVIQSKDMDLAYLRAKSARNENYAKWQAGFFNRIGDTFYPSIKPMMMKWQAVRVISFKHSESAVNDWWENYQDAVFRVFVQPQTFTAFETGTYKQWYVLCPEDGELVNRHELERVNELLQPRNRIGNERYFSADRRLRSLRAVPVECCRHLRHETTAGELPYGL